MTQPVLAVRGLSKKYCSSARAARYALRDIAGELLPSRRPATLRAGEFWALHDVSFDLDPGEAMAVLGRNGTGKTTLLKLAYGLLKPDEGEIRVGGSVEALIELRAGVNPALTGRENIGLGAALSGLDSGAARTLAEQAEAFAGLDGFMDTPVQSYSSGMRARLAFAIVVGLKPDLLLVDEALAVGDVNFQRKCMTALRAYLADGGSLLFVTHNIYQAQAICQRAMLLDYGRLAYAGTALEATARMLAPRNGDSDPQLPADTGGPLTIEALHAEPVAGGSIRTGEAVRLTIDYRARERVDAIWGFTIWTGDQWVCITGDSSFERVPIVPGSGRLSCVIPRLPLVPGRYLVRFSINEHESLVALTDWNAGTLPLEVGAAPNLMTNAQAQLGQLMQIDVDWAGS